MKDRKYYYFTVNKEEFSIAIDGETEAFPHGALYNRRGDLLASFNDVNWWDDHISKAQNTSKVEGLVKLWYANNLGMDLGEFIQAALTDSAPIG